MARDIATVLVEAGLFAAAGCALSSPLTATLAAFDRRAALRLLPLALAGPLAMLASGYGAYRLYVRFGLTAGALSPVLLALAVDALGLVAGGALLLRALPPRRGGDGGGGDDDLPPPPDPGGPDGWAEFERRFSEYAAACDARRRHVLVS